MSCEHGNHESACDLCDAKDAAYEFGRKDGATEAVTANKERWAFKISEIHYYLNEALRFSAMSPRVKENIATALEVLSELETVTCTGKK